MQCYAALCYAIPCYACLRYAMLCYVMLCYAMLRYAMLCFDLLCSVLLCCAMLCYAMQGNAALCCATLCYATLRNAMLRYAMLCYATLCCAMLCYAIPCYTMACQTALWYATLCDAMPSYRIGIFNVPNLLLMKVGMFDTQAPLLMIGLWHSWVGLPGKVKVSVFFPATLFLLKHNISNDNSTQRNEKTQYKVLRQLDCLFLTEITQKLPKRTFACIGSITFVEKTQQSHNPAMHHCW